MWAAIRGRLEVVKFLLSKKAKPDLLSEHGNFLFIFSNFIKAK